MKLKNPTLLLRDPAVKPTNEALKDILGKALFDIYKELTDMVTNEFELECEWRFYNDGKVWLCKVVNKKKTIFWLSIWEECIKTSFYFTEKTRAGISELPINKEIKDKFEKAEPTGRLIPLILDIDRKQQLKDLRKIIGYKKKLK